MPILKADKKEKEVSISAKISESLKNDIDGYISFAGLSSVNEFLIKASEYTLSKDSEWKKFKASKLAVAKKTL